MHENLAYLHTITDKRPFITWQKFICGGRVLLGPDARSLYLSTFLIGSPAFTFIVNMLIRIKEHEPAYGYGVLVTGIILTFLVSLHHL